MTKFFRFSPSRLALSYIALSVLVLALFAIPLWYAWHVNISTFRAYVDGEDMQRMLAVYDRDGATGLASAIESKVGRVPGDEIMLLADASKLRLAGNLPGWPVGLPDAPGTYGLAIDLGDSSMRVVASHVMLPGGHHFLIGRESARFQSLTEFFWYGIAGATAIVMVLGAAVGWRSRRALLSEVQEISRTASAIVEGDLSRRLVTHGGSSELDTLARTVNGMLERLARQNVQLEDEIAVRREVEQALLRAHDNLEELVAQRTAQLAQANDSVRRSEAFLAEGQRISGTGSWAWSCSTGKVIWSEEQYRMLGFEPGTAEPSVDLFMTAVHPEDRVAVLQSLEQATQEKRRYSITYRVVLPDGALRHVHSVGRPVAAEGDQGGEYIGITTDITDRLRGEAALRDSEERYARAMEGSNDGLWEWNPATDEMFISARARQLFGVPDGVPVNTRAELRARGRFHPEDLQRIEDATHLSVARQEGLEIDYRVVDANGDTRWMHSRGKVFGGRQGQPVLLTGSLSDITERKRAEEELRRQKAQLDELFDLAPDAIVLTTLEPRTLRVNNEFTRMFGYTQEEVIGRRLRDFIAPGELSPEALTDVPALLEGRRVEREVIRQRKDGTRFHAHITAARVRLHDEDAAYLIYRDISERKRADEEVQRQKAHLDELFELAPDAVVLTGLSNPRTLRVNKEFTRTFGYTSDEVVGQRLRPFIVPDELGPANLTQDPDLLAGHKVQREVVRRRKDGTQFHAHITAARIRFENVEDAAYVIYRDISESKQAEALIAGENRVLEMIAKGSPLTATLDALCHLMEEVFCGCLASIILIDRDGRLRHGAAPSLPASYTSAFEGMEMGACSGPCGVAAHRREAVIVSDIETYPHWDHYRSVAAAHDLKACWSTPVFSSVDKILGTFAIFYREARSPSAQEQTTIRQFSHLASIVIERTEAVNALRRSDERFALAVAASMDGIWDWDIVKNEMFFSERTQRIYGLEPGVTVRQRAEWRAMIDMHPDDVEAQLRSVEDYLAGSQPTYEGEWRVRHPDGLYRWVRIRGLCERDAAGRAIRMAGSVSDINTRKCAEQALRASEQRYALAMGAAGEGHWDWNVVTDEYYCSPRMLELYGFPPGTTFAGRADFLARVPFHPEDRPKWEEAAAAHFAAANERFNLEIRVVPHGETRWIHLTGICSRDASGNPLRWTGSVTDVTDRKHVEEALLDSERRLRRAQRLEAVGTLAGGIAHDFNNILGAILGYGEMAVRDAPKGSRLRRDLDSIVSAGERGRALVDRILAFSRSGVGERIAVHVEDVVREALDLLCARLPPGITIEARLNAGRAAMRGDPTQVHQVLMNLATNGLQAMPEGGVLRVSLHASSFDQERVATIGAVTAGDYVVLKVEDSGTGIAPDVLERIFDPFFTTKDVGVGTGLGLSLVHGIVTEVGGSIDVESTAGHGSVFTVYFPRVGDASDSAADEAAAVPQGRRQQVLVVDDEEPLVNLATRTLEDLGYAPVGFTSSTAALEALRAEPQRFDAVITDERMPGLSGSALIREVRAIRSSMPILLVSGYVGGMVTSRAYNSGATEVLKKPLSARELAMTLAKVFEAH